MIVQIRGTSGSGKTTAMRAVMKKLSEPLVGPSMPFEAVMVEGRRNPLWYKWGDVAVIGSYESTCGGVDTIHGYEQLQTLVASLYQDYDILMEGLLLSEDSKQTLRMVEAGMTVKCLFLNTPIETCLERVQQRRAEKGNDKPLNPTNTTNRVATIERARVKLEAAGVYCRTASSNQAPKLVTTWLKNVL